MKKISYICMLLLGACSPEKLSQESVVQSQAVQRQYTALDDYIQKEFVAPYGISVEYRWNKTTTPKGIYHTPPDIEKVQPVLEAIKMLWLEVYTLPNVGGKDFMKGKNPIKIYLYGGKNIDYYSKEGIAPNTDSSVEFHLYNVNDFNPKSYADVFVLMRSVHHQFAKQLGILYPFDIDTFAKISLKRYNSDTQDLPQRASLNQIMRSIRDCQRTRLNEYGYIIESDTDYEDVKRGYFSTGRTLKASWVNKDDCSIVYPNYSYDTEAVGAHRRSFLTIHSALSPYQEFAEIVSAYLTHSPSEIQEAIRIAKTPLNAGGDASLQQEYNQEAVAAHSELTQKLLFVTEYFRKQVGINLERMQIISIQRLKAYVNR